MDKFEDAFKKISKVNLATHIELWGEPKTEKLYFEAGQQSRQAEINQLQSQINEMAEVGLSQESVIKEKDKGIESALYALKGLKAENDLWGCDQVEAQIDVLEKALRGGHG
ncbi:hypothetical protein [Acinetobacter bereziniae]|uniref:Uncharacterized protein n=1 Tax=Acinetobacter bereziniae NIPH 3 TaxID=1217651 RepID=N8YN44_ACIBZ|nr:hypothetical protein [Acinetobacter bereziniae]ENV20983.1 hypothetical protein F963_03114 [Acinetobacter bereziniae NIPH 3]